MKKQENTPVAVVSEGYVFSGVRLERAYTWTEICSHIEAPLKVVSPTNRVLAKISATGIPQAEKSKCREILNSLSHVGVRRILVELRRGGFR